MSFYLGWQFLPPKGIPAGKGMPRQALFHTALVFYNNRTPLGFIFSLNYPTILAGLSTKYPSSIVPTLKPYCYIVIPEGSNYCSITTYNRMPVQLPSLIGEFGFREQE